MSAIDMHAHAFPDNVAERAIRELEKSAEWKAKGEGTIASLLQSMDAGDVDIAAVATIATKPDQVKGIFKWCKKIRSDRIEPLPSVHPATPKPGKWVQRFAKENFAGVKLHPLWQGFTVDDPALDEVYTALAGEGLFLQVHCGQDIAFPQNDRAAPERVRRVAERHPELTLVCTHLGGWQDWDASEQHLVGTRVYLETSYTTQCLPPERELELIRRHGIDRVLFGTDWPWATHKQDLKRLGDLGLTDKELKAVRWLNATRLLGY